MHQTYSLRNDAIGFAIAALKLWTRTAADATNAIIAAGIRYNVGPIPGLYAYDESQLLTASSS